MLVSEIEIARDLAAIGCGIVLSRPVCPPKPVPAPPPEFFRRLPCREELVQIIRGVAAEHDVCVRDILSHRRPAKVVRARYAAIRAVAKASNWSPKAGNKRTAWCSQRIASLFERDHTTILYALGTLSGKRAK